ncbi:ABC transporter [Pseudomonas poae]|uniref:ABC transporter n=1 Tax=Pseudomonas poae TaxID=200451 RepID=A0A423FJY5_9PSED|nr:Gldg family protein [Pseudomonas poae]ROM58271.1 ABC transporter [Pseudomonas poae]
MRSALRTGMTLMVISLLFLAFNLVWIKKLPDIRWDFSQEKKHTLLPATRHFLTTLEGPLDLYYFNSINDPKKNQLLKRYGQRVEDLLKEFEKAARGLINLHVIDPTPFSEEAYKASLFGLDDTQGFLGLIGTRAGQSTRRIEAFNPDHAPLLEYEISHLILELMQPERPTVGLLSGLASSASMGELLTHMRGQFNLVELSTNIAQVPSSIDTLMVVHPRTLPEHALYAIEQHVLKGAKLMIFIDPVSEMDTNAASPDSRLEGLLAAWGVQMPTDKLLVDDLYATSATLGPASPTVLHPARLELPRQAMSATDISSWKLSSVIVSSSGALFRPLKSRMTFTPLLQSSRQSVLLDAGHFAFATTFDSLTDEAAAPRQAHVIAARLEGPAFSVFPEGLEGQPPGLQKAAQIQVVVVADTDMLADAVIRSAPNSNVQFILNTLDNLAAPPALANIRPRAINSQPLHTLEHLRDTAAQAYRESARELERRLERTEQEWRRLSPQNGGLGAQAVGANAPLQALNKERLRLPMELNALKVNAYAPVRQFEHGLKLLLIATVPLLLCLVAWVLALCLRRRRSLSCAACR